MEVGARSKCKVTPTIPVQSQGTYILVRGACSYVFILMPFFNRTYSKKKMCNTRK